MSVQSSYSDAPEVALEGMPVFGIRWEDKVDSGLCSTRKLVSVAVTAGNNSVYTVTINDTDFVYTADGSASTAEIVLGLKALINAGTEPVLAQGSDTPLLIESTISGEEGDFDYEDDATLTGDLVATVLVAAGQEVPFGHFVCQDERDAAADLGPADYAVRLPRLSTDITGNLKFGVALRDKAREANDGAASFRGDTMIPVLRNGCIWVAVEQAVAKGDAVYVRYAAGGDGLGAFGNTSGSSERALLSGATYRSAAGVGELAMLEFG